MLVDRTMVQTLREMVETGEQSKSEYTRDIMRGVEMALDLLKLPKETHS